MTPVLAATGLYRFYHSGDEETAALRGVDLTVEAGEIVALVGPSGSGKSTLLACIAGLDEPDGGSVVLRGAIMTRRTEQQRAVLRAHSIGFLMQSGNLFEHLSVADNMRLQQALAGLTDDGSREKLLQRLGIANRGSALPSQLSGGESARAGLAVALAAMPSLLICDEPTAEVDAAAERDIIALLRHEADHGVAVIVATHSETLATLANRVITLCDGRIRP